jgi:uncharacterized protein (DUF433 family)
MIRKLRKPEIALEPPLASAYFLSQWRPGKMLLLHFPVEAPTQVERPVRQKSAQEQFRNVAERLRGKHPAISTYERVLGGEPHIQGTRLSVAHVLGHLYHLGSIDAVVEEFKHSKIGKEQIKEAIAYAHDFMEMACDPSEDDD